MSVKREQKKSLFPIIAQVFLNSKTYKNAEKVNSLLFFACVVSNLLKGLSYHRIPWITENKADTNTFWLGEMYKKRIFKLLH